MHDRCREDSRSGPDATPDTPQWEGASALFARLQLLSTKADGSRPELASLRTAYVKKGS